MAKRMGDISADWQGDARRLREQLDQQQPAREAAERRQDTQRTIDRYARAGVAENLARQAAGIVLSPK